jgi:serine phosphatase RsbU (regulator of sigma subunit)
VATVRLDLAAGRATVRLAGHPPPLLLADSRVSPIPAPSGRLLGIVPKPPPPFELPLNGMGWSLLLYTDGLIEGRMGAGDDRLDVDGLCAMVAEFGSTEATTATLPAWLAGRAETANGGPLADDVAMLLVSPGGGR